jgi:hypothetical protein
MEPVTTIVATAAITVAVEKFAESAIRIGKPRVAALYQFLGPQALAKAEGNIASFVGRLRVMVGTLVEEGEVSPQAAERALDNPDLALLVTDAVLAAAQTESQQKHDLLARLVAERLASKPDDLLSLVSKRACDTIPALSPTHLRILGLMATTQVMNPAPSLLAGVSPEEQKALAIDWLIHQWAAYSQLICTRMDFLHLQAESCMAEAETIGGLEGVVQSMGCGSFLTAELKSNPVIGHIYGLWRDEGGLRHKLTPKGCLIGIYVSDLLTGNRTDLSEFR